MTCPRCGTDTPIGAAFCAKCGAPQSPQTGATGVPRRSPPDVTRAVPDLDAFDTIGGATPTESTGTHEVLDPDVTRYTPPGGGLPTAGSLPTASTPSGFTGGAARHVQMLVAGQTLGTRYHIIRLLGVGGMGAVYHAWDAELGVAVALKVIRSDVTVDPAAAADIERQFKQELLLARQVTHKHVVRIHDLGDIDGIKYITMPYIQGDDLATILKKEGKLDVPRALRYVRQIVEGLVAAHEAGVVHRDLKPANIMVDGDDQTLIMDFGIAGSASKTGQGAAKVVGTLAYMAPEQAQAQPTDQRADVYALGMMFREMLIGRQTASAGEQAVADLMQRIKEAPPSLRTIDATIPEPLDALITRCVQPEASDRFQTSAELAAALATLDDDGRLRPVPKTTSTWRMAAAAAVIVLAIGIAAVFIRRPVTPPKPIDPVSILVADFDNKTGDPVFDGALEQSLGIVMEGAPFISSYRRQDAQRVAAQIKAGSRIDEQVGRLVALREGIKLVLAGNVEQAGQGYRIGLRLIDPAGDGKLVKAFTETASSKPQVLKAVDSLARRVRKELGDTNLKQEEKATSENFTAASLEAARAYTVANDLAVQQKYEDAIVQYKRTTELDPNLGRAYSGWAISAAQLGRTDESAELWKKALAHVDRMTEREKYRTLGTYYSSVARNQQLAIESFEKLVAKYPGDGAGYNNLALAYFRMLRFEDAYKAGRRLLDIYPRTLLYRNNYVLYAMYASDFQTAAAEARKIVAETPTSAVAYLPLAIAALDAGNRDEAIRVYQEMKNTGARGASTAAMGLADLAIYEDRYADADATLKQGIPLDKTSKNVAGEAAKLNALAEVDMARNRLPSAAQTATEALKLGRDSAVVVPAARTLMRAGREPQAEAVAADSSASLEAQTRAYGKLLEGEIALRHRRTVDGIDALLAALKLADLWLVRYSLGVAYVEAGHYPEALTALEACYKRRGEATAVFNDDIPTFRYLAALPYWLGRAQEGLNMAEPAKAHYEAFVNLRKNAAADPLVEDARRRISSR